MIDLFCTNGSSPPPPDPDGVCPDLLITGGGTVFLIHATTPAGLAWLADNVSPDGVRFGSALVVEHRYIDDIVRGALDAGLGVEAR